VAGVTVKQEFDSAVAATNKAGAGVMVATEGRTTSTMPSRFKQKYFVEDGRRRIMELFEEASGALEFDPEEQLLQEGLFTKYNRKNVPEVKTYLLTSRKLVYGIRNGPKLRIDLTIPLTACVLRYPVGHERKGGGGRYTFLVLNKKKSFHAGASVPDNHPAKPETDELFNNIRAAAHAAQTKEGGQPLPDDAFVLWAKRSGAEHKQCTRCEQKFGLLLRRHHCRACGCAVCAVCSNTKMMIDDGDEKRMRRVCLTCANKMKDTRTYGVNDDDMYA
jgi:hypothetical protein